MLDCCTSVIEDDLKRKIADSDYAALLTDESTYRAVSKKMIVYVRIIKDGKAEMYFIRNCHIPDGKAETIYIKLKQICEDSNLT